MNYMNFYLALRVSEFTKSATTDITGIVSGRNFITLPPEILGKEITQPGYWQKIYFMVNKLTYFSFSSYSFFLLSKLVQPVTSGGQ